VLSYYVGWNYILELYFWIILAALLIISVTIFFARPKPSIPSIPDIETEFGTSIETDTISEKNANNLESEKEISEEPDEEEEKDPEVIIAEEKRKWSLSFAILGLIFVMFGGIVLWIFDLEFTTFLGSCMIYVGMMSLLKGISFQIPEERTVITGLMPVLIFGINFFLLNTLLGVIGQSAWMVQTDERRTGDLFLIYILPYLMWIIVPSFSKKKSEPTEEDDSSGYSSLRNFLPQSMKFVIFTYLIFNITNNYIFIPSLRQYAKVGFDIGIYFVAISLVIRIIITFLEYRVGEPKEADKKDDFVEDLLAEEMDEMQEERDNENLQKKDINEEDVK
jgi:hypothetical protein